MTTIDAILALAMEAAEAELAWDIASSKHPADKAVHGVDEAKAALHAALTELVDQLDIQAGSIAAVQAANQRLARAAQPVQDWKKEPEYVPPLVKWAQADAESLKADAARYRWLRDNSNAIHWTPSRFNKEIVSGFSFDGTGYLGFKFEEAIDAAMKGTP